MTVASACRHMGVSRQAYYQGRQRSEQRSARSEVVVELVKQKRLRQHRLGTRKLHHLLQGPLKQAGATLGRDAMFDVLRHARMLVATRRAYHKTTDSHHRFRRHPNLVKVGPDQIQVTRSEQLWVADITYLPTAERAVYLSLVTDAHSRKIVGWHVHASLQTEEVAQAMRMALRGRQTSQELVHHSDRGNPVLLDALPGAASSPRHQVLDDGWLRLLPERAGRAGQRYPQGRVAAAAARESGAGSAHGARVGTNL